MPSDSDDDEPSKVDTEAKDSESPDDDANVESKADSNDDVEEEKNADDDDDEGDKLEAGTLRVDPRDINSDRLEPKVDVRQCVVGGRVRDQIIDLAKQAIEQSSVASGIAKFIKSQLDKEFHPTWHCIVGRDFSMAVEHFDEGLMYFYVDSIAVLVFKHAAQ